MSTARPAATSDFRHQDLQRQQGPLPCIPGGRLAPVIVAALMTAAGCNGPDATPSRQADNPTVNGSDVLVVVGDWGAGTPDQEAVAATMESHIEGRDVGAIVTTGDNFYSDDADVLMEPFSWATEAGIPFWITWGNHDVESARRIDAVNETFDDPPRWTSHRWGDVDVVILDSSQLDSEEQTEFLTESLDESALPTIVVFHVPPYSCGARDDGAAVREDLVPHFDDDVFLVLNGHEHNYQRFDEDGITYVISGGGGAPLTSVNGCSSDDPIAAESAHHFLVLEQGDGVTVSVIDVDGEPIDEFEVPLP